MDLATFLGLVAVTIGLVMLGHRIFLLGKAINEALKMVDGTVGQVTQHRRAADANDLEIERLRKNAESLRQEKTRLEADTKILERDLSPEVQSARQRFYIASDRWTSGDQEWLVDTTIPKVTERRWHPAAIKSWDKGRLMVLWAPSAEQARRAIYSRYPTAQGYVHSEPRNNDAPLAVDIAESARLLEGPAS